MEAALARGAREDAPPLSGTLVVGVNWLRARRGYRRRVRLFPPPRLAAAADAAAIVVFAVVGLLSHHGDVSARGLARDALPLLGGWFGTALLVGLYARPAAVRLAATWLVGITAGVALRAAVLGHTHVGKEAAFLSVALAFTLLFSLGARLCAAAVAR